jgi:hypothetical protein
VPTAILHTTDQVFCKHCGEWHPVAPDTVDLESPDRAVSLYPYTTCRAGHYYVGCIGTACIHPTRQPPIWTLTKDTRTLECCLRSEGELGWNAELYRNGVMYGSRRFVLHAEAVADAQQVKSECEREGWA